MLVLKATGYSQNYAGIIAAPLFIVCHVHVADRSPLCVGGGVTAIYFVGK